jgi:hypothetical protein
MIFAFQENVADGFFRTYSGELVILFVFVLTVATLIVLVPQLLKTHLRKVEMAHIEHLKALEQGLVLARPEESSNAAGRTTTLVPIVVVISAATVTCFLVAYRSEMVFSVALSVWAVAGVVSLAAITGGVALMGRLAQLQSGVDDFDDEKRLPEPPRESKPQS